MTTLPITAITASVLGLLLIPLSVLVGATRARKQIWFLDGSDDVLLRRMRAQGNFVEYVPIALILIALVELGGAQAGFVAGLGGLLVAARVTHAASILRGPQGIGRGIGAMSTILVMFLAAGWLLLAHLGG